MMPSNEEERHCFLGVRKLHVGGEFDACDDVPMASEGAHKLGVPSLGIVVGEGNFLFGLGDGRRGVH